ncbi:hypothetical protein Q5752_000328 [Cryptotrichosporon argae]
MSHQHMTARPPAADLPAAACSLTPAAGSSRAPVSPTPGVRVALPLSPPPAYSAAHPTLLAALDRAEQPGQRADGVRADEAVVDVVSAPPTGVLRALRVGAAATSAPAVDA